MGGIWRKIPFTYAYMWVGSLALAGLPFFAGYYSKDLILEAAFADHSMQGNVAFWLGIGAATLTAFYSWRLLFLTFHGTPRASHDVMHHVHESPKIMLLPLLLLAFGAVFAGWIGAHAFGMVDAHGYFWGDAIKVLKANNTIAAAHHVPSWVGYLPIVVALAGIGLAWVFYIKRTDLPAKIMSGAGPLYRFLLNKWYFDELYDLLFVRTAKLLGKHLWLFWDTKIVDGLGPNGMAWLSDRIGRQNSKLHTGYVYHYAFAILIGVVAIISWLLWTQLQQGGI